MCDTLVQVSGDRVRFAKNSDRDANEAQVLEWHPRRTWPAGATVRCTHVEVPQVEETAAILLSRPFWIWGAEMGANEHGVVIGNEAVFTRAPVDEVGLLGMDLLRLALERATSADAAVQVLVSLLEEHGQGGRAGLEDPGFRYHNSFLVADATEAWVLETAGRHHATERVTSGVRAISNVLTIPGFAEEWSDRLKTWVAAGRKRRARTSARGAAVLGLQGWMDLLRDHGDGDPAYRWLNGTLDAPCMHGGGLIASSVTTAAWVSELDTTGARHWATASSAPDISLFKPVAVDQPVDLGPVPTDRADDSRWWRWEKLHRAWLRSPGILSPLFLPERNAVQARWLADPPSSADAFAEEDSLLEAWTQRVLEADVPDVRPWYARRYWALRSRQAGLSP